MSFGIASGIADLHLKYEQGKVKHLRIAEISVEDLALIFQHIGQNLIGHFFSNSIQVSIDELGEGKCKILVEGELDSEIDEIVEESMNEFRKKKTFNLNTESNFLPTRNINERDFHDREFISPKDWVRSGQPLGLVCNGAEEISIIYRKGDQFFLGGELKEVLTLFNFLDIELESMLTERIAKGIEVLKSEEEERISEFGVIPFVLK